MLAFPFLLMITFSCIQSDDIEIQKKAPAANPNIWIFMMAGQSNMAGRGAIESQDLITNERIITINRVNEWVIASEPLHFYEPSGAGLDCGMSFASEMLKHVPDSITIAMVPCAVGGSSIFQWLEDKEHRGVHLLSNFREKAQLAKQRGVIKGIIWHQGESNANPDDIPVYQDALLDLFSTFKAITQNDQLPIVMGELGRFSTPEEKASNFEKINAVIGKTAQENENLYVISSEGLNHKGDNLHFDSASQRELGRRYAEVIRSTTLK